MNSLCLNANVISSQEERERFILDHNFFEMRDIGHDFEWIFNFEFLLKVLNSVRLLLQGLLGQFKHLIVIIAEVSAQRFHSFELTFIKFCTGS